MITNTDNDIIDETERTIGAKFDEIVTAEQAQSYKTVWVNRQGEVRPVDVKETFLVGDMRTLVYVIKGIASSASY